MRLKNLPYELEKYVNPFPVTSIGGVSIVNENTPKNQLGRVMKMTEGSGFGYVDIDTSKKWFMRVNDKIDYEVSFWFKQPNSPSSNFELSMNAFSCYDVEKKIYESKNGSESKIFINAGQSIISTGEQWYFARYIIFGHEHGIEPLVTPCTSLGVGSNLMMSEGTTNIIVNVLCKANELRIFDFKVKPLRTEFSTGFVQGSDILEIWRKNNNKNKNDQEIDTKANELLLPYNTSNVPIKLR